MSESQTTEEPPTLTVGTGRNADGQQMAVFYETADRARHGGQWLASRSVIGQEDAR